MIFIDPETEKWVTADEYLSGDVKRKLRMAKIYAEDNALYKSNVEALTQVQPEHIPAEDIDVRLGTTWIEPEDYEQFIYELLEVPERLRRKKTGISTADMLLHGSRLNTHRQQKSILLKINS